jgi:RNA polymerase sigma-70 factor (sigma-E family)
VGTTERDLTAEGLTGDRLADLYARHVGTAVGLARLLTGDPDLAEDLAHEAFLRVAGRFGHLRRPDAFPAYLRRVVVNLCNARLRRLRLERAWLTRPRERDEAAPPPFDPVERDAVWRAIELLPFRQRAAVVLRYYEDLSFEGIADALGCSTRAARSLLTRGMESLRETVSKEEP